MDESETDGAIAGAMASNDAASAAEISVVALAATFGACFFLL